MADTLYFLQCGPTKDDSVCRCGCRGDDTRCDYWLYCYENNQEVKNHSCCNVSPTNPEKDNDE